MPSIISSTACKALNLYLWVSSHIFILRIYDTHLAIEVVIVFDNTLIEHWEILDPSDLAMLSIHFVSDEF